MSSRIRKINIPEAIARARTMRAGAPIFRLNIDSKES